MQSSTWDLWHKYGVIEWVEVQDGYIVYCVGCKTTLNRSGTDEKWQLHCPKCVKDHGHAIYLVRDIMLSQLLARGMILNNDPNATIKPYNSSRNFDDFR